VYIWKLWAKGEDTSYDADHIHTPLLNVFGTSVLKYLLKVPLDIIE